MDEHVVVDGDVVRSPFEIADISLKPLTAWITKHNNYASREAIDTLIRADGPASEGPGSLFSSSLGHTSPHARLKRFAKTKIYARVPAGLRAGLYFIFRYFVLLGMLDGRAGFYYHLFQALWYRTLVDAKIMDIRIYMTLHGAPVEEAIRACTGLDMRILQCRPASEGHRSR